MKDLLKVFFRMYLVMLTIFLLAILPMAFSVVLEKGFTWEIFGMVLTAITTIRVLLFALNKNLLPVNFWRVFTIFYIGSDIIITFFVPHSIDSPIKNQIVEFIFAGLPLYAGLIILSFSSDPKKSWW